MLVDGIFYIVSRLTREIDFHIRHMICLGVCHVHLIAALVFFQTVSQLVPLKLPKLGSERKSGTVVQIRGMTEVVRSIVFIFKNLK